MTRETVFQVSQFLVIFGIVRMTGDTESHVKPGYLVNLVHVRNVTVAGGAFEAALYVPLVVEVYVARHRVDLVPGYGLFLRPILPDLGYFLLEINGSAAEIVLDVAPRYMGMTAHAFFDRWDSGVRGYIYKAVAVLTGYLIVFAAGVDFMTEPDRLNRSFIAAFRVIEKIQAQKNSQCQNRH
jgi:hypothetical protein